MWVRSSHSYSNGNCVEVAWRTADASQSNGHCVEVGRRGCASNECVEAGVGDCGNVHVRDSKDRQGPQLTVAPAAWEAFTRAIKAGEFAL